MEVDYGANKNHAGHDATSGCLTRPRRANAGTHNANRFLEMAEHELEGEENMGDGESVSSNSQPTCVVDFSLLSLQSLVRYVQRYQISVTDDCNKSQLVAAVEAHFCEQLIDEREVVSSFLCASGHAFPRGTGNVKPGGYKRKAYDTPIKKVSSTARRVPRRASGSGASYKLTSRAPTYGDMISYALSQLPGNQGTLDEICDLIETQYASQLNHEMESGPRRIPVWKASVRKIINLNYGMRFRRSVAANGNKAVFSFSSSKRR